MKTAIARRAFRRPDNLRLVACGEKFAGADEVIDELARRRMVHSVVAVITKATQPARKKRARKEP